MSWHQSCHSTIGAPSGESRISKRGMQKVNPVPPYHFVPSPFLPEMTCYVSRGMLNSTHSLHCVNLAKYVGLFLPSFLSFHTLLLFFFFFHRAPFPLLFFSPSPENTASAVSSLGCPGGARAPNEFRCIMNQSWISSQVCIITPVVSLWNFIAPERKNITKYTCHIKSALGPLCGCPIGRVTLLGRPSVCVRLFVRAPMVAFLSSILMKCCSCLGPEQ